MIGFWIVAVVMVVPIVAIITEHREKTFRYKTELVREELELEKLKQQNFIIETEKMKLELEQMKLDYSSDKNDVMKV
ncbi:hypothetical protein NSQ43_13925 [Sporosarcina sp. FSL W8-0480]|uniref:hypothetical protein n=1 Tax=Sporosarcina sp. FSL W8-0480 TaxID=2954701 RepID=UPI0030D956D9